MKKGDIAVFTCVLAIALISAAVLNVGGVGKTVTVSQNNEMLFEVSLSENKVITLETNTVEIKDGRVKITYADCKNQICVNHKEISKKGESIVCLPNKVIVEIKSYLN